MRKPVFANKAYETLLRNLASGLWAEGTTCPPIRQLAERMGISLQPIQRAYAMAGREGLLTLRPRQQALVCQGAAARAQEILSARRSKDRPRRLVVLIPEELFPLTGAPFQNNLARAVTAEARRCGLEGRIVAVPQNRQVEFARRTLRRFDAALLINPSPTKLAVYFSLAEHGFPMLSYCAEVSGLNVPLLRTDNDGACRKLGQTLIANGHRNICMLSSVKYEGVQNRHVVTQAWMDFLKDAGILDDCMMPVAYHRVETFEIVLDRLLRIRPRITGIVVANPMSICDIIDNPLFRDLRIPEDLSVAALSSTRHMPWPSRHPPLTCFKVDMPAAGQCAMRMIQEMLAGNADPKPTRVPLNIQLTDSIGPPPKD